jgi:putative DNA-invertase from lambdoid prophage Rac
MSRIFAYCRVSTAEQTTANQVREIAAAGFSVEKQRIVSETVSGSVAAMLRKGFVRLVDHLERGDVLIVTKIDRLGRNAMDVRVTVEHLGGLTSPCSLFAARRRRSDRRSRADDDAGDCRHWRV